MIISHVSHRINMNGYFRYFGEIKLAFPKFCETRTNKLRKSYRHKYFHSKMKFRALCFKLIFKNSFPKLLSRFSFWTKINVQNQKPNFRFKSKSSDILLFSLLDQKSSLSSF